MVSAACAYQWLGILWLCVHNIYWDLNHRQQFTFYWTDGVRLGIQNIKYKYFSVPRAENCQLLSEFRVKSYLRLPCDKHTDVDFVYAQFNAVYTKIVLLHS